MSSKLTLRIEDAAIETAKRYAASRGTSVSKLVEPYFARLDSALDAPKSQASFAERVSALGPNSITARLSGLLAAPSPKASGKKTTRARKPALDEAAWRAHLLRKHG